MYEHARDVLSRALEEIRDAGTWKEERIIASPQGAEIEVGGRARSSTSAPTTTSGSPTTRSCSPRRARRSTSAATASPPCASSAAPRTCTGSSSGGSPPSSASTTPSSTRSCFDANGGVFEPLLGEQDAIISDALNHASIIDGVRLSKAQRLPLRERRHGRPRGEPRRGGRRAAAAHRHRRRLLHGRRPRQARRDLRPRRAAPGAGDGRRLATPPGFMGRTGRGTPEHYGVQGRVDIITSTLGKALGGAAGGFVAGRAGDRRPAAPALAPLPVLQHARARRSSAPASTVLDLLEGSTDAARPADGERAALPRAA